MLRYHAALGASEGILFLSLSPGLVATEALMAVMQDPKEAAAGAAMGAKFAEYAPQFQGPISPEESVRMLLDVIGKATVEKDGGEFLSHFGNKQWL